jgi:predicted type IV restriction endonuclease
VKRSIRRFSKPLADLRDRDANEGDTRLLVTDFLCEALGYDKYEDLTTEYLVKGEFADYGIRIDRQLVGFIEVKRIAQQLLERHLRQVQNYAVNEGVEWMILTNGAVWQVYHLTAGLPVSVDLVIDVDLFSDVSTAKKADDLFYLTREAMKRERLNDLWKERAATSPSALAKIVLSEPVVDAVRRAVRRNSGLNPDADAVLDALRTQVIRPDLV